MYSAYRHAIELAVGLDELLSRERLEGGPFEQLVGAFERGLAVGLLGPELLLDPVRGRPVRGGVERRGALRERGVGRLDDGLRIDGDLRQVERQERRVRLLQPELDGPRVERRDRLEHVADARSERRTGTRGWRRASS